MNAPSDALTPQELASVGRIMADAGVAPAGPLAARVIAGGRSNLTLELTDGRDRWVLRTPPRSGRTPSAHDVAREYRVTAALGATDVPVADALLLHEDEAVLGGPFTISRFVDGRTLRSREDLADLDDAALRAAVETIVETLARLHAVDHVAVGLGSFGRPDGYAERQLRRWAGQWEIVGLPALEPLAAEVVTALRRDIPAQRRTSIVHGDYRIDNTLLAVSGPEVRVAAVVDWELSTIGDPVADVAMMCGYRESGFDLIMGGPSAWTSPRLPDTSTIAHAYASAAGHDLEDWTFHLALAHFKIAVIAAGIDHRRRAGSGSGPGFDSAGESVRPGFAGRAAARRAVNATSALQIGMIAVAKPGSTDEPGV